MATINIGNLAFTHKGDYDGSTAYVKNDVVYYSSTGSAYIAKQSTTGNLPTSTAHWNVFSAGSGGIWNAGLSLGSAGQVVKVNSGASALEFGDAGGGLLQIKRSTYSSQGASFNSTSGLSTTPLAVTITPTAANSSFWINAIMRYSYRDNHDTAVKFNVSDSQVGSTTAIFSEISHTGTGVGNVFFGYGSYASDGAVDNYWLEQGIINGMYTPASNNASARTFTIVARNNTNGQIKWNETQQTGNSQSSGAVSWIEVWEIANGIYS